MKKLLMISLLMLCFVGYASADVVNGEMESPVISRYTKLSAGLVPGWIVVSGNAGEAGIENYSASGDWGAGVFGGANLNAMFHNGSRLGRTSPVVGQVLSDTLAVGGLYQVSFDVAQRPEKPSGNYHVQLLANNGTSSTLLTEIIGGVDGAPALTSYAVGEAVFMTMDLVFDATTLPAGAAYGDNLEIRLLNPGVESSVNPPQIVYDNVSVASEPAASQVFSSPSGNVQFEFCQQDQRLKYSIRMDQNELVANASLGLVVDGTDIGLNAEKGTLNQRTINETYSWRGLKSQCRNHCNEYAIDFVTNNVTWQFLVRVYDDGAAFRYILPGDEGRIRQVQSEPTTYTLPSDSKLWYQTNLDNYEGQTQSVIMSSLSINSFVPMPVTVEFANNYFACVSEVDIDDWTGTVLKKTGLNEFASYYHDNTSGLTKSGIIKTPWRIFMLADSLNGLVQCDLVHNCADAPDAELFPDGIETDWVQVGIGRVFWPWWAYGDAGASWDLQKDFVDDAARLGCELFLVDAGWEMEAQGWLIDGTPWQRLKELCDYAALRKIGIIVWRPIWNNRPDKGPGIPSDQEKEYFFSNCQACGVKGVKIDYFNSENHDTLIQYEKVLAAAAKYQIMVNFHGANKPSGQMRKWPNVNTREGIRGLEHNKWNTLSVDHYTALPFTRFLAGHGDFTPATLQSGYLKGTTVALQLASALIYNSPCLHWADKASVYLSSPAVEMIRRMPTTFEQTRVLPSSKIGVLTAMAKKNNDEWFVGMINGSSARSYDLALDFLGSGNWLATTYADVLGDDTKFLTGSQTVTSAGTLNVQMNTGGGFVGRFSKLIMTPHGGAFEDPLEVTLTCVDNNAEIRYTTDGTEPTSESMLYTGPFAINYQCVVKAAVFLDGQEFTVEADFVKIEQPIVINTTAIDNSCYEIEIESGLPDSNIYFTVDGSLPVEEPNMLYKGALVLNAPVTINAKAVNSETSSDYTKKIISRKPDVYLSNITPVSTTIGWGEVHPDLSVEGNPITIASQIFERGIGTHAHSEMVYAIETHYKRFVAAVGVDMEIVSSSNSRESIVFSVYIDELLIAQTPVMKVGEIYHFDIPIPTGSSQIKLISDPTADGQSYDHADWAMVGFITAVPTAASSSLTGTGNYLDLPVPGNETSTADLEANNYVSWMCTNPENYLFDVYIGLSPGAKDLIAKDGGHNCHPVELAYGKQYYWQIVAKPTSAQPSEIIASPVWTFNSKHMDSDFDQNNMINLSDFSVLAQDWLKHDTGLMADHNSNGTVDMLDLEELCYNWLLNY